MTIRAEVEHSVSHVGQQLDTHSYQVDHDLRITFEPDCVKVVSCRPEHTQLAVSEASYTFFKQRESSAKDNARDLNSFITVLKQGVDSVRGYEIHSEFASRSKMVSTKGLIMPAFEAALAALNLKVDAKLASGLFSLNDGRMVTLTDSPSELLYAARTANAPQLSNVVEVSAVSSWTDNGKFVGGMVIQERLDIRSEYASQAKQNLERLLSRAVDIGTASDNGTIIARTTQELLTSIGVTTSFVESLQHGVHQMQAIGNTVYLKDVKKIGYSTDGVLKFFGQSNPILDKHISMSTLKLEHYLQSDALELVDNYEIRALLSSHQLTKNTSDINSLPSSDRMKI